MISTSAEYQAAIVGSPRRVELLAVVDLSDPDQMWGNTLYSAVAPWSRPAEIIDKEMDPPKRYATLERNRWLLDESFDIFPDNYQVPEEMAYCSAVLSDADGYFSQEPWVEQKFSNVRILQNLYVVFSSDPADGIATDFRVEISSGGEVYHTAEITGNRESVVAVTGFTVHYPDSIKVICTRWSLPYHRMRVMEVLTGLYERWGPRMLATFSCTQQGDFSCLSLPYGSVSLSMDNKSRRFEPRRKDSIFQSIEERQGIDVYVGVRLPDGFYEHIRLGIFYHAGDGWKTSNNSLTMNWYLVDIIGLVSNRTFLPPTVLPTTLGGWLEAVVSQLGKNFADRWDCDPAYRDKSVTAVDVAAVSDKQCGDIIRWACMAAGVWPRADAETGKLVAEPLWSAGNKLTLQNLNQYPAMRANQSLAALIFTLSDGTEYVVSGNSTSADATVSIQNPFLHTQSQALEAARLILSCYGGNVLETVGRGDPSSEIGDVDTVWLDESNATTARRAMQTLQFQNGVLQGCQSKLLQADGAYLFTEGVVFRKSGTFQVPDGVERLRLILVGTGEDGQDGTDGGWEEAGQNGQDGRGGLVWADVIDVHSGQSFQVVVSNDTTFGIHSSANGTRYPSGYSDILSGESYARSGVPVPEDGSGDGGKGGAGGNQGVRHQEKAYDKDGFVIGNKWVTDVRPGNGRPGSPGARGCAVIRWEKVE